MDWDKNINGQCHMFSGYVVCHWAMSHVIGPVCFRAMFFVLIGLMFSGNVFRVDRAHVFGQCFLSILSSLSHLRTQVARLVAGGRHEFYQLLFINQISVCF